jgi:hypothetical protein
MCWKSETKLVALIFSPEDKMYKEAEIVHRVTSQSKVLFIIAHNFNANEVRCALMLESRLE